MFKYYEVNQNGHNIRCKLYYNDLKTIKNVILFSHGFAGHKDNGACEKFAMKALAKHKTCCVLIFNWPAHGDDVKKRVSLADCFTYLNIVLAHIQEHYHPEGIYSYSTSFGSYVIFKYIHDNGNPFKKIAARCPAINMYESLTGSIIKAQELALIQKGKDVQVGFDRKVNVSADFLNELKENDIRQYSYLDYAEDMLIIHGSKDEVIPLEIAYAFAENNVIEFFKIDNADHRFQNPAYMDLATKEVLNFFDLK